LRTALATISRANEREPRAFDHDQRMKVFLRDVLDAEHAGKGEVEGEQHRSFGRRLAFELEGDLIVRGRCLADADIDLDVDGRLGLGRRQRAGRVRILKREILDVLAEHAELRRGLLLGRLLRLAAIGR
jgi:hypothetical protein